MVVVVVPREGGGIGRGRRACGGKRVRDGGLDSTIALVRGVDWRHTGCSTLLLLVMLLVEVGDACRAYPAIYRSRGREGGMRQACPACQLVLLLQNLLVVVTATTTTATIGGGANLGAGVTLVLGVREGMGELLLLLLLLLLLVTRSWLLLLLLVLGPSCS